MCSVGRLALEKKKKKKPTRSLEEAELGMLSAVSSNQRGPWGVAGREARNITLLSGSQTQSVISIT